MSDAITSDPLADLSAAGVSVWLDDLSRELLAGGGLAELIAHKHVVGVTTNPTIFASALSKGERYDDQLRQLGAEGKSVDDAVFALATDDVRTGCRPFAEIYRQTGGTDGRVSIEVDPRLARDADATVAQAQKLWDAVGEPNLFVKIPATHEGLAAVTTVIARGISVNVTLVFSLERYRAVQDAYLTGLESAARWAPSRKALSPLTSQNVSADTSMAISRPGPHRQRSMAVRNWGTASRSASPRSTTAGRIQRQRRMATSKGTTGITPRLVGS